MDRKVLLKLSVYLRLWYPEDRQGAEIGFTFVF